MYLLDTNVISELRKPRPHGGVLAWFRSLGAADIHVSAVTIGEIQAGIEITRRQDLAKARDLEEWLNQVAASYTLIPMDGAAFREWSRLMAGRSDTLYEDAMLAAQARLRALVVATRNVADFHDLGVAVFNPFAPLAD